MPNFYDNVSMIQDVSGIVTNENARLVAKEDNINQAYENQKRMILLNQSYGQRMQQYTFISIVLVITFAIIGLLLYLQKEFPAIPSNVYDVIMILLIGGVGIYVYNLYNSILARDKLDFSKLSPDSPNIISADELQKMKDKAVADGKISSAIVDPSLSGTCVGQACCPTGKTYDTTTNKCNSFTTLEQAYSNNEIIPK
jgi:hypothetical protein